MTHPRLKRHTTAPKPGIVHLGPGAFFRAFTALYTQDALIAGGGDWGIIAASLQSPTARDQLGPQGGVYTVVEMTADGPLPRLVSSVAQVLVAPENPDALIAAMSDPAIRIVTLTVTEKGYHHAPATGHLYPDDPDIRHDLTHPDKPRTAPGFLVAALARRRAAGHLPFTVLSCDNLPHNGRLTRDVVLDLAAARDLPLAEWIARHVPFPSSMVDRITPAMTDADLTRVAELTGHDDQGAVQHEPFRQWVIEEDFVGGHRPGWEAGGAEFVRDVRPHETMKLRCLNGTHSALAYLGYLAGYETIADTVADPAFAGFCRAIWAEEIIPTLTPPQGTHLPDYCATLLRRYQNPAIRHRLWQIAMDGSQKLPQRILGTMQDALADGRETPRLALTVAAWMRYVGGVDERGQTIDIRDPMAGALRAASDGAATPEGKVAALLALETVFTPELSGNRTFRDAVTGAYLRLLDKGARAEVAALA